jgi:hypothetical protein
MGATIKDLKDLIERCKKMNLPDSTEIVTLNNYGAEVVHDIGAGDLDLENNGEIKDYIIIYT